MTQRELTLLETAQSAIRVAAMTINACRGVLAGTFAAGIAQGAIGLRVGNPAVWVPGALCGAWSVVLFLWFSRQARAVRRWGEQ